MNKATFYGHEGMSFYLAFEVLNKMESDNIINEQEKKDILTIISLHGSLFNHFDSEGNMKKPEKVFEMFRKEDVRKNVLGDESPNTFCSFKFLYTGTVELFNKFILQVKNDSTSSRYRLNILSKEESSLLNMFYYLGRFFIGDEVKTKVGHNLGKTLFTEEQFLEYHSTKQDVVKEGLPTITLLVGPPCAGKSTWLRKNLKNEIIISRDDTLLNYGFESGLGDTYSEIWNNLSDSDHKKIDLIVQTTFNKAVKEKKDIIIDMTNVSTKSRRKWLNPIKNKYFKKAVVFATSRNIILERNQKRFKETGKLIPEFVIDNFIKGFTVPTYAEVNSIEWVF